jgi:hypothetical protein
LTSGLPLPWRDKAIRSISDRDYNPIKSVEKTYNKRRAAADLAGVKATAKWEEPPK